MSCLQKKKVDVAVKEKSTTSVVCCYCCSHKGMPIYHNKSFATSHVNFAQFSVFFLSKHKKERSIKEIEIKKETEGIEKEPTTSEKRKRNVNDSAVR